MFYTLAFVYVVLWLLGLVASVTAGGLIHVLPVIAGALILLQVIGAFDSS